MDRMTITHDLAVTAFEAFGTNLDDVWALGLTRGVTVNGHQLAAIIELTDSNEADEDGLDFDGNPWRTTVTVEETRQGLRDADCGLWLHADGTWATFPESAEADLQRAAELTAAHWLNEGNSAQRLGSVGRQARVDAKREGMEESAARRMDNGNAKPLPTPESQSLDRLEDALGQGRR